MFLGLPVATWGAGFYVLMLVLSIAGLQERYADSRGLSLVMLRAGGMGRAVHGVAQLSRSVRHPRVVRVVPLCRRRWCSCFSCYRLSIAESLSRRQEHIH